MTGTREEWLAARLELLDAEKELTRRSDEQQREGIVEYNYRSMDVKPVLEGGGAAVTSTTREAHFSDRTTRHRFDEPLR